jgi:ribosomal-protein-serine acetyltransferase
MADSKLLLEVSPTTILRAVSPDDAGPLFALVDANRAHLREWLPWLDDSRSEVDTLAFLAGAIERRHAGLGLDMLIEHQGEICGGAAFNTIDRANRIAVIGYWLAERWQGRGIMTACVSRMVRHAFDDLKLNRITISIAVANRRSQGIAKRLGFQAEGILRESAWLYDHFVDQVLYALIRSDWEQ